VSIVLPDTSGVPRTGRIQTRKLCHDSTMRKTLVLAAVALLAAVSPGSASAKTVQLGAKANGTRVTLARGDRLQIKLASTPSTGYTWRLVTVLRAVLKPAGSTYKGTARLPGAGGTQTFTFRPIVRGTTPLQLLYSQAGSSIIGKRFRLTVVVR
jgi:predicted secreted protein